MRGAFRLPITDKFGRRWHVRTAAEMCHRRQHDALFEQHVLDRLLAEAFRLPWRYPSDQRTAQTLLDAYGEVGRRVELRGAPHQQQHQLDRVRDDMMRLARSGFIWLEPVAPIRMAVPDAPDTDPHIPDNPVDEVVDWIGVKVTDPDGAPLAHVRCLITDADGASRERTTDESGNLRFDGIASGQCTITFPDLDRRAFQP